MHHPLAKKLQITAGRLFQSLNSAEGDGLCALISEVTNLENLMVSRNKELVGSTQQMQKCFKE